ncbi:SRPBCC family protein [Kribbella sp. NPDC058693]|uniref:SRPBCC family protein n=1 Tax=Kribbella sp. NPDC058693 TaxID=3346602 RepID=UPI003667D9F9
MKFTNTITINRSATAVFAYLANLENLPQWNYALAETQQLTPGPRSVGTRYRQTRTIPTHAVESLEIIELVPDQKLTVEGTLSGLPATLTYTLDAKGDATTLTNSVDLRPPRPLNLVAPIAAGRIKSAVAANLNALKQLLEQS